MITHSTKPLRISCVSALLMCACVSYGQTQSARAFATDAELVALANKYVHTPVKKIEKPNGDVFFQRNLSAYLHASQQPRNLLPVSPTLATIIMIPYWKYS